MKYYCMVMLVVLLCALAGCAAAQKKENTPPTIAEIELSNGNTLTAELFNMHAGKAHLNHKLLGKLSFGWKDISTITTDREVKLKMEDGDRLTGKLEQAGKGNFKLAGERVQTTELPLSKVVSINKPPRDTTWKGAAVLTYTRTAGNQRTADLSFLFRGVRETELDSISLKASYDYGTTRQELSKRSSAGELKYNYKLSQVFYVYVKTGAAMDYFKGLELRTDFGGGGGYKVLNTDSVSLSLELGAAHSNEDYREPAPGGADLDTNYGAGRWALELEIKLHEGVTFYQLMEETRPFDHGNLWRFHSESILSIDMSSRLSVKMGYILDHDRRAAGDVKKTDGKTLVGIGFKF